MASPQRGNSRRGGYAGTLEASLRSCNGYLTATLPGHFRHFEHIKHCGRAGEAQHERRNPRARVRVVRPGKDRPGPDRSGA